MSDPKNQASEVNTQNEEVHQSRKGKEPNKVIRFGLLGLMGLLSLVLVVGAAGIIYAASLWSKVQKPVEEETGDNTIPSELMDETDENGDPIVMTLAPVTEPETTLPAETEPSPEETTQPSETETETETQTETDSDTETLPTETTEEETTEEQTTETESSEEPTTETAAPTVHTETAPPETPKPTTNWNPNIPTRWEIDPGVAAAMSNYYSFVVFGVDARNNTSITKGAQGDVIIIVSINKTTKEVKLLSIYRDTLFAYSNLTNYGKISTVYRVNGAYDTMRTLNYCCDLQLTNYVAVNWKAVVDVVNIMGGLDVELTASEANYINLYYGNVAAVTGASGTKKLQVINGVQHLDGVQVVTHCRNRKIGDDWSRTARQRNIINIMLAKAKTMSIGQLTAAANAVFGEIGTNFGLAEVISLLSDVKSYRIVDTAAFPFSFNSDSTIYYKDFIANVSQMHAFLFNNGSYTPSLAAYNMGQNFATLHTQHFGW